MRITACACSAACCCNSCCCIRICWRCSRAAAVAASRLARAGLAALRAARGSAAAGMVDAAAAAAAALRRRSSLCMNSSRTHTQTGCQHTCMSITSAQRPQGKFQQALLCFQHQTHGRKPAPKARNGVVCTWLRLYIETDAQPCRYEGGQAGRQAPTSLHLSRPQSGCGVPGCACHHCGCGCDSCCGACGHGCGCGTCGKVNMQTQTCHAISIAFYYSCSRSPRQADACMEPRMSIVGAVRN